MHILQVPHATFASTGPSLDVDTRIWTPPSVYEAEVTSMEVVRGSPWHHLVAVRQRQPLLRDLSKPLQPVTLLERPAAEPELIKMDDAVFRQSVHLCSLRPR